MSERPVFRNAEGVDLFGLPAVAAIMEDGQRRAAENAADLGAAWVDAVGALPVGWQIDAIQRRAPISRRQPQRWAASASGPVQLGEGWGDDVIFESAAADTPALALRALAARLRQHETPQEDGG